MSINAVSTSSLSSFCELCQGRHPTFECHLMQNLSMENISYMSNFNGQQQNVVHGNAHNPSWRNHPNFSWSNQENNQWRPQIPLSFGGQNAQQPQSHFQQDKSSSLGTSWENKMDKFMDIMATKMDQQDETIKRLEGRFEQMHQDN